MGWTKDAKKTLWLGLIDYIRADKANMSRQNSYMAKILKAWGVQHYDKFSSITIPVAAKLTIP